MSVISGSRLRQALRGAERAGFEVSVCHAGHVWGHIVAPNGQRFAVWSTPKDSDIAARMIGRFVTRNKEA